MVAKGPWRVSRESKIWASPCTFDEGTNGATVAASSAVPWVAPIDAANTADTTSTAHTVSTATSDAVSGQRLHQWIYIENGAWAAGSPNPVKLTGPLWDPIFPLMRAVIFSCKKYYLYRTKLYNIGINE